MVGYAEGMSDHHCNNNAIKVANWSSVKDCQLQSLIKIVDIVGEW